MGQTDTTHSTPRVGGLIEGSPYEGLVSLGQRQEEAGEGFHGLSLYPLQDHRTASPVDRTGGWDFHEVACRLPGLSERQGHLFYT